MEEEMDNPFLSPPTSPQHRTVQRGGREGESLALVKPAFDPGSPTSRKKLRGRGQGKTPGQAPARI